MSAPTLVAFGLTQASVASGAAVTTPSLSWQTDDVVVLFTGTPGATGGETIVAPTTTGSGISFGAAKQIHQSTGTDCGGACYAAVATANSSGTFSEAATHDPGNRPKVIGVYVYRGSAGIGNSNIFTGATPAGCALTPTGADGSISWCVFDWAAAATVAFSPTATTHGAGSPGPTASPASAQVSPDFTYYVGELDDQTGTGSVNYGIASGSGPFTTIAIEAQAGGPPPPAPDLFVVRSNLQLR